MTHRPLPSYDGSVGPLPPTDIDTAALLARYAITKPTLYKRRDALVDNGWASPQRIGKRVYYSAQDVHLLDCLHYWSSANYNIVEIVDHLRYQMNAFTENGGVHTSENDFEIIPLDSIEVAAENTTTDLVVKGLQTSAQELRVLGEEFVEQFAARVGAAVREALPSDLLAGHDFLEKAAQKNYLLSGQLLAEALHVKSSTITGWDDETVRAGFAVMRVGRGQYRVEKLP